MKSNRYFLLFFVVLSVFTACSDGDDNKEVPKEPIDWRLIKIKIPETLYSSADISITKYDDGFISEMGGDGYLQRKISRESSGIQIFTTINSSNESYIIDKHYYINNNRINLSISKHNTIVGGQAFYQSDSVIYTYNSEGFITKASHYREETISVYHKKYWLYDSIEFTIHDGNITKAISLDGTIYNYTYYDKNLLEYGDLVLLSPYNLFLAEYELLVIHPYLGKKPKNAYADVTVINPEEKLLPYYTKINYDYKINSNNILEKISLNGSGMIHYIEGNEIKNFSGDIELNYEEIYN